MYYAGIDAHRSYLTVAIVDASGEVVRERKRVPIGDGEPLLEALDGLRPLKAVVETCPFWRWIHDTLEPTEVDFHLAHASKVEAIGQSDVKTDEIDARMLARLLSVGLVPEVYAKPEEQRDLVRKVRHRKRLVRDRTKWVNRIHRHPCGSAPLNDPGNWTVSVAPACSRAHADLQVRDAGQAGVVRRASARDTELGWGNAVRPHAGRCEPLGEGRVPPGGERRRTGGSSEHPRARALGPGASGKLTEPPTASRDHEARRPRIGEEPSVPRRRMIDADVGEEETNRQTPARPALRLQGPPPAMDTLPVPA